MVKFLAEGLLSPIMNVLVILVRDRILGYGHAMPARRRDIGCQLGELEEEDGKEKRTRNPVLRFYFWELC